MANNLSKFPKLPEYFELGFNNECDILPIGCRQEDVVLLEGPRGTFKRTMAINFLLTGLVREENVLLIELAERTLFDFNLRNRISRELQVGIDVQGKKKPYDIKLFDEKYSKEEKTTKYSKKVSIYYKDENEKKKGVQGNGEYVRFTEIAFKSGYILPEEFIQYIRDILLSSASIQKPISRIVFSDVGMLGVSYPLLRFSKTSEDLFLTAFVHIIRNYRNISLLMTGDTAQYAQADEIIHRSRTLADAVLKTSLCDVFGDRYVVLEGEGLTVGPLPREKPSESNEQKKTSSDEQKKVKKEYGEYTPGIIVPREDKDIDNFEVDMKRLEGLVGFDTGHLYRPGIIFHAFEEGDNQILYNKMIEKLLKYTFGVPTLRKQQIDQAKNTSNMLENKMRRIADKTDSYESSQDLDTTVVLEPFTSYDSDSLHNSLKQFGGRPFSKTIVSTVDEFCLSPEPGASAAAEVNTEKITEKEKIKNRKSNSLAGKAFINLGEYGGSIVDMRDGLIKSLEDFQKDDTNYVWPYYSNVLLLAYRIKDNYGGDFDKNSKDDEKIEKDFPGFKDSTFRLATWVKVKEFATKIAAKIEKADEDKAEKTVSFEYFHHVDETLSCVFLDAMASGMLASLNSRDTYIDWKELLQQEKLSGEQVKELNALQELLIDSEQIRPTPTLPKQKPPTFQSEKGEISKNAAVYLCWYSQLRELIELSPELTDKLMVMPLPAGGFRGDWYLGVSKGSVSNELGKQLISVLCSEREQYKRFIQGVGLPTLKFFADTKNNYFAWPKGEPVSLARIYKIHENADSRSRIEGYNDFRSTLTAICKQMIRSDTKNMEPKAKHDKIEENVNRLFTQIKDFKKE